MTAHKRFLSILVLALAGSAAHAAGPFKVTSNLKNGQAIPADYYGNAYGCTAPGTSPALKWENVPTGTKSLAITVFDESAPTGSGFWHYVLFDIPTSVHEVEVGALSKGNIPSGSVESMTDSGKPGYFGPCPPPGRKHTYVFTVHALKVDKLGLNPATSTPAFASFNMWANELGRASIKVTAGPRK